MAVRIERCRLQPRRHARCGVRPIVSPPRSSRRLSRVPSLTDADGKPVGDDDGEQGRGRADGNHAQMIPHLAPATVPAGGTCHGHGALSTLGRCCRRAIAARLRPPRRTGRHAHGAALRRVRAVARLARCSACGAATTYPVPDDAELEQAYTGWYRPDSGRFSAGGDVILGASRAALARRLDRIAPSGPILDVGAGAGSLITALQRAGGRRSDSSEKLVTGSIAGEIEEFGERSGEWAAVVFWHSLEHLRHPGAAVDQASVCWPRGGVIAIAVPNLASWQARCFGDHWFHRDLPRHLVHLPARALLSGLEARGLRIERCSHWRGGQLLFGWLYGMVRSLPGHTDLYSAIRRPEARGNTLSGARRAAALGAAIALTPVAGALLVGEVTAHAGGTVYVEARCP